MLINLSFGASVSTTARAVVNSVAQFFQDQFSDPITINISVAFGNIGGLGSSSYNLANQTFSYSQIKTALTNDATSSDDVSAISSMLAADPITGTHSWNMTPAEAKALGLIAGNGTASDGSMTFSNTAAFDYNRSDGIASNQYDFFGVVAHEMTEVMGREINAIGNNLATGAGYHPLDLFKFASATNHSFAGTQFGYFSVNNGFSDLNPIFNTDPNGDFGDWANSEAGDSFRAFSDMGVVNAVTTADLVVMDAIGFTRTDDYISTTATAGQVTVGSSTTGNINYVRDHDWIRVQLTAGVQYTIDEQGQSVGAGTLSDPLMALYDSAGHLITSDDDSGGNSNSRIVYAPSTSGAYYIDAGAFDNEGTGTYRVSVSSAPAPAGSVAISDMSISEGNSGTQVAIFTVTRTGGTSAFDVNFVTSDGSATTADGDYNGTSGTLHFAANANTQTISVTINGDLKVEPDQTFFVNLSGATNGAVISDNQGIGTIANDDHAPINDFNGDSKSDILWRSDGSSIGTWDINDGQVLSTHVLNSAPVDWKIAGNGDFNADSKFDILWRSDAGAIATWDINDGQVLGIHVLGSAPADWKIAGTGDFDGDTKSDILWRSDAGVIGTWDINDGQVLSTHSLSSAPADWKIAGTGDFSGDGKTDILWRSDAGVIATWDVNDGQVLSIHVLGSAPADWKIAGIGDFRGDGKSDILWRSDAGVIATWDVDDGQVLGTHVLGSAPADWKIAAIGDFNGDRKSDILWRSDAGVIATWDINDGQVLSTHVLSSAPADWHVV
jgi:hypothetical protein